MYIGVKCYIFILVLFLFLSDNQLFREKAFNNDEGRKENRKIHICCASMFLLTLMRSFFFLVLIRLQTQLDIEYIIYMRTMLHVNKLNSFIIKIKISIDRTFSSF